MLGFEIELWFSVFPFWSPMGSTIPNLPGRRIRVRGWVEWWNGPVIEISHAQEIEVLGTIPRAD